MTWVYLDDGFPTSEKVGLAGGDAGWLYVCALCYCRDKKNGGMFPKAIVPQFSDRKSPARLAKKLVEVNLWEEAGDFYSIHDYDDWNQLAEAEKKKRAEKAKRAADARWHGKHARADAQALLEQSSADAPDDAQPVPSPITPSGVSQSSTHVGGMPEHPPTTTDELLEQTWNILAERDRQAKVTETGKQPYKPAAWLKSAVEQRRSRHEGDARRILELEPDVTPLALADTLDGVPPAGVHPKPYADQEPCKGGCSNGNLLDDDGMAYPCPECRRAS